MAQRAIKRLPGLKEAFYDPLGSFNDGRFGGPIGGHSDHVHVSDIDPQGMLRAIALAQQMGLAVRENPYVDKVDPVHVQGSYHYRDFPGLYNGKQLGEAVDVSGAPNLMADYYRAVTAGDAATRMQQASPIQASLAQAQPTPQAQSPSMALAAATPLQRPPVAAPIQLALRLLGITR